MNHRTTANQRTNEEPTNDERTSEPPLNHRTMRNQRTTTNESTNNEPTNEPTSGPTNTANQEKEIGADDQTKQRQPHCDDQTGECGDGDGGVGGGRPR